MNVKLPTKNGYYWVQHYNPTTGLPDSSPEIVQVFFGVYHRRKLQNRVVSRFWSDTLEKVTNHYWSAEIIPPVFAK